MTESATDKAVGSHPSEFMALAQPFLESGVLGMGWVLLALYIWLKHREGQEVRQELLSAHGGSTDALLSVGESHTTALSAVEQRLSKMETLLEIIESRVK